MAKIKIKSIKEIENIVKNLRKERKKIVTINGAFDIVHVGHLKILKEAKKQGDILIVGLNSDKSIKMNKGPKRPINNENDRAKILAALDVVDYVVIFNEKDPRKLLSVIKPNVHVNGSEYGEKCIEADVVKKYGGRMHTVKLKKGHSTTNLIRKVTKVF
jgi:rfaE bifunctional protein nucleotidyltransferase chain/domain